MISSWGSETVSSPKSAAARASRRAVMPGAWASADERQLGVEVDDRADVARAGDRPRARRAPPRGGRPPCRSSRCRGSPARGRPSPRRRSSCGGRGAATARRGSARQVGSGAREVERGGHGRAQTTPGPDGRSTSPTATSRALSGGRRLARGGEAGRVSVEPRGLHEVHVRRAGGDDRPLPAPPHDDRQGPPGGLRGRREVQGGLGVHQALRGEGGGGAPPGDRGEGRRPSSASPTAAAPPR